MKTICATASLLLLGAALYADAHSNSLGAVGAMTLSVLWFIVYCNADRLS